MTGLRQRSTDCSFRSETGTGHRIKSSVTDDETEVDLLIPVEGALNSDPRVFRAKGIDSLPAIGIQVGGDPIESECPHSERSRNCRPLPSLPASEVLLRVLCPYRGWWSRSKNMKQATTVALLAAILTIKTESKECFQAKPMDHRGGYLFAVVNPFDSSVDVGVLLEPAGNSHTNVSLILSDAKREISAAAASFLVPQFTQQWTQLAFSVRRGSITLFFRCSQFGQKAVVVLSLLVK